MVELGTEHFVKLCNHPLCMATPGGEATFEEKLDLVAKLGIKVYPSEDLRSR